MSDHQDQPSGQGQPSGYEEGGQAGQAGEEGQRDKAGKARGGVRTPPPPRAHTPLPRAGPQPGANRARHGAKRARQREGVPPRLRNSTPGQGARHTQAKQGTRAAPHASTHHGTKTQHHHGKHPHPTTNEPPRTSPSPAVPTARQPPSGWTCVRPAVNPAPAGYEPAASRMDVCAPGSEPSPCRLRNSRRPDGRVCARR